MILGIGQNCPVCEWCTRRISRHHDTSTTYAEGTGNDSDSSMGSSGKDSNWESSQEEVVFKRNSAVIPREQRPNYLSSKDAEYCAVVVRYAVHKPTSKKEPLGTIRSLQFEEEQYFAFMYPIYQSLPLFKINLVDWQNAPHNWVLREKMLVSHLILGVIETLHKIAEETCGSFPRFHWMETLDNLPPGPSRFAWCLMFCKATNGVLDVVVCQHFKRAIAKQGALTLEELVADPQLIARILRQTSKWAKNTIIVHKILKDIVEKKGGGDTYGPCIMDEVS
jgi:hypothetical protein